MAEITVCLNCGEIVNLEIDIYRDENGDIYCPHCNYPIRKDN